MKPYKIHLCLQCHINYLPCYNGLKAIYQIEHNKWTLMVIYLIPKILTSLFYKVPYLAPPLSFVTTMTYLIHFPTILPFC